MSTNESSTPIPGLPSNVQEDILVLQKNVSFQYQPTVDLLVRAMYPDFRTLHGLNNSDVRFISQADGVMKLHFKSINSAHYNGVKVPRTREDALVDLRKVFDNSNIIIQIDTVNEDGRVVDRNKYLKSENALITRDCDDLNELIIEFESKEYLE